MESSSLVLLDLAELPGPETNAFVVQYFSFVTAFRFSLFHFRSGEAKSACFKNILLRERYGNRRFVPAISSSTLYSADS